MTEPKQMMLEGQLDIYAVEDEYGGGVIVVSIDGKDINDALVNFLGLFDALLADLSLSVGKARVTFEILEK